MENRTPKNVLWLWGGFEVLIGDPMEIILAKCSFVAKARVLCNRMKYITACGDMGFSAK